MTDYPFIKFAIFFIVGIIISQIIAPGLNILIPSYVILFVILVLISFGKINNRINKNVFFQFIVILLITATGALFYRISEFHETKYPFKKQRIKEITVEGKINSKDLPKEKYFDFYFTATRLIQGQDTLAAELKLLCKLKRSGAESGVNFSINDIVIMKGTIQKGREQRNPFEFDYNEYLNSKGIAGLFYIKTLRDITIIDSSTFSTAELVYDIRFGIAALIDKMYSNKTAALLKGLLLADRSGIDYDTKEAFVNSGVIHVLAVSGLHVGYIAIIFLFLFGRMNIYLRNILTIIGLLMFVLVTGAPPSVLRASIMASILILSNLSIRSYNNFNSISLAAIIILIINPSEIFNPGFQLSFSAVLSIFIIYPKISSYIYTLNINSKLIRGIILFMGVSLSAQIGTLPFTLHYFNKLSIVALGINLLVIPAIGIIVSLGITSLLFGSIVLFIGKCYAFTNELVAKLMFFIVNISGHWDYSHLYIPQFSFYDSLIFYIILFTLYRVYILFSSLKAKIIAAVLIILNAFIYFPMDKRELLPANLLSVAMIDIGQGDSFLIKFPNGKTALIDAGNASFGFDNGERVIYPLLRNLGIDRINYGFVSHMDADHYMGYESLIQHEIIDTIYKPFCDTTVEHDMEFEELVHEFNIPIVCYDRNMFKIGNTRLYVLNDKEKDRILNYNMNDRSGVMKLVYGSVSILFTGDAGKRVERDLVKQYGSFLKCDILKVGHHGSKTSTGNEFLNLIKPKSALISAGLFNRFKHPSKEVIDRFQRDSVVILRTDLQKAVIIHSDGSDYWIDDWIN